MRPFKQLSAGGKFRRIFHTVKDFFRYTIWGDFKRGGIRGAYHWVRCHVWNRYHVLDLRKPGVYDWGWIDRDFAMWLACFNLLVEYVEKETPFEVVNWDWNPEHANAGKEIRELYEWWKRGRKAEQDELHAMDHGNYNGPAWQAWMKRHDELEAKDDEMLDRLMKVRRYLWT